MIVIKAIKNQKFFMATNFGIEAIQVFLSMYSYLLAQVSWTDQPPGNSGGIFSPVVDTCT